jgi:myosin-5
VPIFDQNENIYDWQLAKIIDKTPPYVSVSIGDDQYTVEESKTQLYDHTHGGSVDDLASMNNLAEGPLLDVLRRRYYNDNIYTFVGDILISFNPYVIIPGIYDHDPIPPAVTGGKSAAVREDPHVFTVAERVYCDMMVNSRNQSLIVSGESGPGKQKHANAS